MENNKQLTEQEKFQQEQKRFNEEHSKNQNHEQPNLQKVEKLEVLDI